MTTLLFSELLTSICPDLLSFLKLKGSTYFWDRLSLSDLDHPSNIDRLQNVAKELGDVYERHRDMVQVSRRS